MQRTERITQNVEEKKTREGGEVEPGRSARGGARLAAQRHWREVLSPGSKNHTRGPTKPNKAAKPLFLTLTPKSSSCPEFSQREFGVRSGRLPLPALPGEGRLLPRPCLQVRQGPTMEGPRRKPLG